MGTYMPFILALIIIALLAIIIWRECVKIKKIAIPFKEAIDLIGLPVVTFTNNNKKFHFLLDTGSDASYMDKDVIVGMKVLSQSKGKGSIVTGNGETESFGEITCFITYKGISFINSFLIGNFKATFDAAAAEKGITIHGILGSAFFKKYKYKLDFENMEAQSNKGYILK